MTRRDPKFDLTEQEREQLWHVLDRTTPEGRVLWAERARLMFGTDHLKKCLDLRWEIDPPIDPLTPAGPTGR
jgi:hypothetical protein